MKKVLLLAAAIICAGLSSFAQKLNTTKTFDSALKQASEENRPVLLIVAIPITTQPATMNGVKINYANALEDKEVIEKINKTFVVYKTTMIDTAIRRILSPSSITSFPAYVFFRPDKSIFYKDFGNFGQKNRYFSMIENALTAYKERSVSDLEKDYFANKNDNQLLKKLIDAREKIGITNNADLIEQYANNLKIGDFNNYENVLYILQAGPYIDGIAYKLAYTNRKLTDSLYRTESLQKRIAINRAIISNTMKAAAKDKNLNRAMAAANYERSTWGKDYRAGDKSYNNQILWYYSTVKDTTNYFRTAMYFYDNHYMNIGADSIKKIETKEREAMNKRNTSNIMGRNIVSKEKMDSLLKLKGTVKTTQTFITVGSASSSYATELNNAAWKFYETGTKNINYLTKAMIWSRRSIELNPIGGYYDTLAHLLYRLGYVEEAIKTQENAIEKSKLEGMNTNNLQIELKKMKARQI